MKLPTEHFYFTKDERQGLYFIVASIILLILGISIFNQFDHPVPIEYKDIDISQFYEPNGNEGVAILSKEENQSEGSFTKKPLFSFDPNRTSKDSLLQLPVPEKVVNNLCKYREKGGVFEKTEDLGKIYGIEPYFEELKPFIRITTKDENEFAKTDKFKKGTDVIPTPKVNSSFENKDFIIVNDSIQKTEKASILRDFSIDSLSFKDDYREEGETLILELNTANFYQLQLVNGIGEYYAQKIIDYRNKIGGFLAVDQLSQVVKREEVLMKILPHFTCDPNLIRKRSINTIQKDSLAYLPTIGFKKASIAIRYRNLHFPLKDIKDLEKIRIFDDEQLEILGKYVSFEVE